MKRRLLSLVLMTSACASPDAEPALPDSEVVGDVGGGGEVAAGDADALADAGAADGVAAAEAAEPSPIPLVDATLWVRVPDAEDPFFAQRPEGTVCSPDGIKTEAGTLEI